MIYSLKKKRKLHDLSHDLLTLIFFFFFVFGLYYHLLYNILQYIYLFTFAAAAAEFASVVSKSMQPHRRQPTRLPRPWDSPGKNTGVGCHFLLSSIYNVLCGQPCYLRSALRITSPGDI